MIQSNAPADPAIHEAAQAIARQCRNVIQGCLREDEWSLADQEFYRIARTELENLAKGTTNAHSS